MEIKKFSADNTTGEDRIFYEFGKNKIYQRIIDSYNSQGYKLYYYKDFNLIEITSVKKLQWKTWGEQIFFLNESEYETAMKTINTSKEIHDKHIESANIIAKLSMSTIVYDILKLK